MTKYEILIQIVQDMPALYNIKQCNNLHELLHHIKYLKIAKETGVQYLPLGNFPALDGVLLDQATQTFQTLQYKFKTGTSIVNHKQFLSKLGQSPGFNIFDYGFQNSDIFTEYSKRFSKHNVVFSDMSDFFDPQMLNKGFEQEVQKLFDPFRQEQEKLKSIIDPVLKELKNKS